MFPSFGLSAWYGGTGSSGGWVGGIVSVLVATQVLKLNLWKFLESASVAIALAIFLGRIGCFIKGCCFGTPAYLPWAISYSQTSLAFRTQIKHQLIESTSLFALPVHPVQLYEALYVLVLMSVQIVLLKATDSMARCFYVLPHPIRSLGFSWSFCGGTIAPCYWAYLCRSGFI